MKENIEQQLREQGIYVSTTVGWSMWPMLRSRRDRVILRAVGEGETLRRGDLPLYHRHDGKYVLHRILKVKQDCYVIRGDNTYVKEIVPKKWVIGVVIEFYRGDKQVSADSRGYRFYATFWQGIYPVRRLWIAVKSIVSRVKHRIFRKKKKSE